MNSAKTEAALSQTGKENALLDYIDRISGTRKERLALHVHLSRLQPYHRMEHHLRMATQTFDSIVSAHEGQIFILRNKDILFIGTVRSSAKVDEAVIRLRSMFADDPLVNELQANVTDSGLTTWYRLDRDYDKLKDNVEKLVRASNTGNPFDTAGAVVDAEEKKPIMPDKLGWLEESLRMADLSNMVRNQSICAYTRDQVPVPIFNELYISIADLERSVAPGVDLTSNRWLFQYLTLTLDKRMLSYLVREGEESSRAFSFNMNVSTLLSSEFQKFDQQVSSALRGRLVIELQTIDVFADMAAYTFARDYVMDRGYRVCIDGLSHFTAPFVDRRKLGFDFAKIYWSPAMASADLQKLAFDLRAGSDAEPDIARVILCRCDDELAIETGLKLGINLFQGRYIDRLLKKGNVI